MKILCLIKSKAKKEGNSSIVYRKLLSLKKNIRLHEILRDS